MNTMSDETAVVDHSINRPAPVTPADALPFRPIGKGFTLLKGVRVLDLVTSVAGPSATDAAC